MAIDITNMPDNPYSGKLSQAWEEIERQKREDKEARAKVSELAKQEAKIADQDDTKNKHTYLLDADFEGAAQEASDKYDKLRQEGINRMNEGSSNEQESNSENNASNKSEYKSRSASSLTLDDYIEAARKKEDIWNFSFDYLAGKIDKDGNPIDNSSSNNSSNSNSNSSNSIDINNPTSTNNSTDNSNSANMGSFRQLDASIRELSQEEILQTQITPEAKKAYEALASGKYTLANMNKYIDTYVKYAKPCDKLYGPLIEKIQNDPALMRAIQSELVKNGESLTKADKEYLDKQINGNKLETWYNEVEKLFNETNDGTIVNQDKFWLPDIGEFYLGNVDTIFLEKIDKIIREKKDALKAAHYASLAPQETLGYDEKKKMYFLRFTIDLDDEDLENGIFDGSHIMLSLDKAESSEDDDTDALDKLESTVEEINKKHYFENLFPDINNDNLNIDIVGISCPRLPRWCMENNAKIDNVTFEEFHKYDINKDNGFIFIQEDYDAMDDNDTMLFVRVMGTWRQAIITDKEN